MSALQQRLSERELLLGELRAQLISFEGRYLRQVGLLHRRLDEWEQKIADLHVADRSREQQTAPAASGIDPGLDTPTFGPLVLRTLYRDLVKLLHPDFATDAEDERRRTHWMHLANDAYTRGDAAALRRMRSGYDPVLALPSQGSVHDEVVRLTALSFQLTQDLEAVERHIRELHRSDSAQLQQRVLVAAREGRDLLAEMAARVNGAIGLAMRRYDLDLSRKQRPSRGMSVEDLVTAEIKPA